MRKFLAALCVAFGAQAQTTLAPLPVAPDAQARMLAQEGEATAQLRAALAEARVARGYWLSLYALAPGARSVAVDPRGLFAAVADEAGGLWALPDRDRDGVAETAAQLAPGLAFAPGAGLCFAPDGALLVAESRRLLTLPGAAQFWRSAALGGFERLGAQALTAPGATEARLRGCAVAWRGALYLALGAEAAETGGVLTLVEGEAPTLRAGDGLADPVALARDPVRGGVWAASRDAPGRLTLIADDPAQPPAPRVLRDGRAVIALAVLREGTLAMILEGAGGRRSLALAEIFGSEALLPFDVASDWPAEMEIGELSALAALPDGGLLIADSAAGAVYLLRRGDAPPAADSAPDITVTPDALEPLEGG